MLNVGEFTGMMLLQVEKELGCDQREEVHMVSGSPGPMQREAGAEQCSQFPAPAEESRKKLVA